MPNSSECAELGTRVVGSFLRNMRKVHDWNEAHLYVRNVTKFDARYEQHLYQILQGAKNWVHFNLVFSCER